MSSGTQHRGLRTKTGCLTCRSRRKKCDEGSPICNRCHLSGRRCDWPTTADLLDRRYASHRHSRHSKSAALSNTRPLSTGSRSAQVQTICLRSESVAHREITRNLEFAIARHFVDKYYGLLILPNCHPDFYNGWLTEIQYLMVQHKSLHYSVLANSASHLHFIDASARMRELALTYYSNALRGLSKLLSGASELENHNGLLMSVMLLYLHGCMGSGTYTDVPRHVNAATRILTLRFFNRPLRISRPFDRLAVESVLYQIFLVTTGLWSDQTPLDYTFDAQFWLQAERLLDQSTLFPGCSNSLNSPVLGVPVTLFKLALSVKQHYQNPRRHDQATMDQLRSEVEEREALVLCDQELDCLSEDEKPNQKHAFYRDTSYLYILNASLLLEQLSASTASSMSSPQQAPSDSWQVRKATEILRRYQHDDEWTRIFIGNWPVYTLGFFVSSPEDVSLVRADLQRRWTRTKFAQLVRFRNDLEDSWTERGFGINAQETVEIL